VSERGRWALATRARDRLDGLAGTTTRADSAAEALEARLTRVLRSPPATLFLLALVVFATTWRVDVFISDTLAVANALANLADGSLHFTTVYYGPADAQTPGVYVHEGRLYGRNYGQVVAALPVLYVLRGLSLVVEPSVLLAGGWSLGVAVLGRRAATRLGDGHVARVGYGLAGLALVANLAFGTAVSPRLYPLLALQTVTLLSAAGLAATMYLLVDLFYERRVAAATAVATMLVGPVSFWATIPKRHVITAFLVLLTVYLFARARTSGRLAYRAGAYLPVGLTAWVSAPEGFLMLAALVPVDLLTGRRDLRSLTTVGLALLVGLLPFLLTNVAVASNPLLPPRLLDSYRGVGGALAVDPTVAASNPVSDRAADAAALPAEAASTGSGTGSGAEASSPPGESSGAGAMVTGLVAATLGAGAEALMTVGSQAEHGLAALAPERLYHVFVRSGRIPGLDYAQTGGETIDLALLESAPLLAALVALPFRAVRRAVTAERDAVGSPLSSAVARLAAWTRTPLGATDLFVLVFVTGFTLVHLPRLPIHSTVTVRYLAPTVPLLVYAVARLPPVRTVVRERAGRVALVALVATLALVVAGLAVFTMGDATAGTLMQAHAVVNLALATLVAGWLLLSPDDSRVGAVALGVVVAAMLSFLVGTGLEYFADGRHYLLAIARLIETAIPIL